MRIIVLLSFLLIFARSASAEVYKLTFEGLKDNEEILEFYNGGTGSQGSSGPNYGISFSANALALIESSAGGSGNFSNPPSEHTVAFWLEGTSAVMNVPAGFNTGFSFYYSSNFAASVIVYDDVNGTGNVLATIPIESQRQGDGCSDSNYCNWSVAGASFIGTAKSVSFGGTADYTVYDDITFGTSDPDIQPVTINGVAIPTAGGSVTCPTSGTFEGQLATCTVAENTGYTLQSVVDNCGAEGVSVGSGTPSYEVTPAAGIGSCTVTATFTQNPAPSCVANPSAAAPGASVTITCSNIPSGGIVTIPGATCGSVHSGGQVTCTGTTGNGENQIGTNPTASVTHESDLEWAASAPVAFSLIAAVTSIPTLGEYALLLLALLLGGFAALQLRQARKP